LALISLVMLSAYDPERAERAGAEKARQQAEIKSAPSGPQR
jgi:hypothetical protein